MQLAYQFPERVERMALVVERRPGQARSAWVLRAATLPGAEWVLPLLTRRGPRDALGAGERAAGPARAAHARRRARDGARARLAERAAARAAPSSTPRARSSILAASG